MPVKSAVLAQIHADLVAINQRFQKINELQARIDRIYNNARFTDQDKNRFSKEYKLQMDRHFSWIETSIQKNRTIIDNQFDEFRKNNPGKDAASHPQFESLKRITNQLNELADQTTKLSSLSKLNKAPTIDPITGALLSIKAPTTKPVMDQRQQKKFIATAVNQGWTKAVEDMAAYARLHKVSLLEVKSQVIDAMQETRFERLTGQKPRDMSKPPTKGYK